MRILYNSLLYLSLPFILLRLLYRSIAAPAYRRRIAERFGVFASPEKHCAAWVHAVSVGEVNACYPLVKKLIQQDPNQCICITTMTPTGSARVQALFGDSVFHVYVPYDLPFAVKNFLKRIKASTLIIMETELWPNLITYTHQANTAVYIANARLSERSFKGYFKIRKWLKTLFLNIDLIAAQSESDAQRFMQLGMAADKVKVMGNLKYDVALEYISQKNYSAYWPNRLVLIAGSTHDNEEQQLLETFTVLKKLYANALLILVPRHPERFNTVFNLASEYGTAINLTDINHVIAANIDSVVGNQMGVLQDLYAASDIAFVGGSLVKHGGQNVLEPICANVPVIVGPHTFNFRDIINALKVASAITIINNADEIVDAIQHLLSNVSHKQLMMDNAKRVLLRNKGALDKFLDWLPSQQL